MGLDGQTDKRLVDKQRKKTTLTLFDRELIISKTATAKKRIFELDTTIELACTSPENFELRRNQNLERSGLIGRVEIYTEMLRTSDFVDFGDSSVLNDGRQVGHTGRITSTKIDLDLLSSKPVFAFLGHNIGGLHNHPALLLYYRAQMGGMLCIVDLRFPNIQGFAAMDPGDLDAPMADTAIFSELVRPRVLGMNDVQIWPISIRLPLNGKSVRGDDMSTTAGICTAFYRWYSTHLPVENGFVVWKDPSVGNVSRLTWTDWWNETV